MNEEDDSSNSSSTSSSSSSASTGTSESVGSISSTSSYSSTYSAGGKRHIFGSKKKGETNVVRRRRPSEDPGKTAEREYKSIWKNKEQIFRALERIEEISNSIQYEEGDIIGFTEEIEWLLEQIAQKGKNMLGSSSTVAQLEAQQLIVDIEGASYTERNNGFLREIFENEVRTYERLESIFNAVIDTADELDEGTAAWIEQTKEGVLTELELAQKSLTSILSKKSSGGRKGSKKKPVLLRHESFIVKENTPVDQPPARGGLQRQISVPHLKMPQKNFDLGPSKYRHKASSSTVSRASVQLNNETDVTVSNPIRKRQNSDSKGGSNRLFINPPSPSATDPSEKKGKGEKEKDKEREKDKDKEKEKEKKKKKKQKSVKESDGKQSDSSKGSECKTEVSPGKDNSAKEDDQREKKSPLTRSKSDDSKKRSSQIEEPKTKPRKLKTSLSKTDLSDDNDTDDHKAQQPRKDRDDDISDDFPDDGTLDAEQDGKGHKMRSRFSKLAQVFHKSKKAPKPGSATQSPIVRPRGSSPQPSDTPSGLSGAWAYQLQASSSPPILSLPPSALGSGMASAENSVASPTQEQQQESVFKGVMIRTLVTLNLTSKDLRTLYAMDDKAFVEYYESKILVVKERLDGKKPLSDLL